MANYERTKKILRIVGDIVAYILRLISPRSK